MFKNDETFMKKDTRFKHFIVPILNDEYKVLVYIGDKEKTTKAICKYLEDDSFTFETTARGKTFWKRGFHPCIWVDGTKDFKSATATLAHEAIHAVTYIMDYLGMDSMDKTGDELLAHSVAAVMRKCL
jgi:hypothetical protein